MFDINDFDETLPGPWEWDVKRLITSIEICGRYRGFSENDRADAILAAARIYRQAMLHFSGTGNMAMWYEHIDLEKVYRVHEKELGKEKAKIFQKAADKALSKTSEGAMSKLTEVVDGRIQIKSDPPLIVPLRDIQSYADTGSVKETERIISDALRSYRHSLPRERRILIDRYRVVDIARKVVGVGSSGMRKVLSTWKRSTRKDFPQSPRCVPGRWHMRMQRPVTGMGSPAISAGVTHSMKPCSGSPGRMQTRMRGTLKYFALQIENGC